MSNKRRITFEATNDQLEMIEELMDSTDIGTKREFLSNAISLMKWAVDKVSAGSVVAAVNEDDKIYRELQMPALQAAAHRATRKSEAEETRKAAGAA
ncbi:MAG: hypothetical protein AAFX10_03835 [Pseudomonadota bacterium]